MANWRHRVKLRDLFESFDPQETAEAEKAEVLRVGKAVLARVKGEDCLNGFRLKRFIEAETEAQSNRVIESLYDFCDQHLIWVD